jgi:rare lipoprotein A
MRSLRNAALAAFALLASTAGALATDKPAALPTVDPVAALGDPYTVAGVTYTPADAPFDDVGYAGLEDAAGSSISIAHRTLPLPSYVEVTALDSGRTILARVERRGPTTGKQLVAMSAAGFAQLGADPAQPLAVRVRRVNPQEYERALLRTNQRAPERLMTPGSLLQVLRNLLARKSAPMPVAASDPFPVAVAPVAIPQPIKRPPVTAVAPKPAAPKAFVAKPIAPKPIAAKPTPVKLPPTPATPVATFSVQVGSFANKANADATAKKLGGKVSSSDKLWRVQLGPYGKRESAESALARAKRSGFGDARVVTASK